MAELVDALVSGTSNRKIVQVRVLFWAQKIKNSPVKRRWWNWYTRYFEGVVPVTACEFESHSAHLVFNFIRMADKKGAGYKK